MKRLLLLAGLMATLLVPLNAQKWGGESGGRLWKLYSVNASTGFLSYYGDLSQHDASPLDKLKYESRPAVGLTMTKHFFNAFGVSGQLMLGQLHGSNSNEEFNASILEYNLHLRADLVGLIFSAREHRLGFSPYAGMGQFIFKTRTTTFGMEMENTSEVRSRVPEFVYFAGATLSCKLPANLAVTADLSLRQCRNDKLDGLVKNDDFDYYSYMSFGLTYRINSIVRQPVKNKARLAHNEPFLSNKKRIRSH